MNYTLTPTQTKILQTLADAKFELSVPEIIVAGLFPPDQVSPSIAYLVESKLIRLVDDPGSELLGPTYTVDTLGRMIVQALARYGGTPAVGVQLILPQANFMTRLLSGANRERHSVEMISDEIPV